MAACGCAAVSGWWICAGISKLVGRSPWRSATPVPRPSLFPSPLLCLLLVLASLGGGLAWAQVQGGEAVEAPVAPQLPPPAAAPAPLQPSPAPASAASQPLRPDPAHLGPASAPRRFDQSLDDLVRQGVVTSGERNLIRGGGGGVEPFDVGRYQQLCSSGALSAQECRGGVAIRWGRRMPGGGVAAAANPIAGGRLAPDGTPLPPISVPVGALLAGDGSSFNLASVFRVTPRPAPILGNGNRRLLLPILGEAVPSSGFGWRLHPLLGIWRMHAGQDLAAPEGTPVVAALSGRVVSSGLAGGYGLAVEIEHQRPLRRTLYGHLSELYVRAGDLVRQGEVVGRVGSTGLSTGPHLHFELRQPADGGWVAVDPGDLDPGSGQRGGPDPIAMLMAQLLASLERQHG